MERAPLTKCLIETHNWIVKNARDTVWFSETETICDRIKSALMEVHGEEILDILE